MPGLPQLLKRINLWDMGYVLPGITGTDSRHYSLLATSPRRPPFHLHLLEVDK